MAFNPTTRIRFLATFVILVALILIGKLFYIQILDNEKHIERGENQYSKKTKTFSRGSIYFRNKDGSKISAATLKYGFAVSVNPKILEDPEDTYNKLSQIINLDKEKYFFRATKVNDPYEVVAERLTLGEASAIDELSINGVLTEDSAWRYYPGDKLASHILGFVGYNENTFGGRYGVERYFDDILNRNDSGKSENFFAEVFANIQGVFGDKNSKNGEIVLTIDANVQGFVEKKLLELVDIWGYEEGGAIVIDPSSGAIKSMANFPNYSPDYYNEVDNINIYKNPMVENVYEMGSIIKPLTLAAAIDAGAITLDTKYDDRGFLIIDDARIENYDGVGRGVVSMQEVLNQSLNTGAVFALQKLGKKSFKEYIYNFGFGEKSGIDLPDEVKGLLSNLDRNIDIEYATASYGQGIAFTPIGTVRALAALANKGVAPIPYVVDEIIFNDGENRKTIPLEGRKVLKDTTAEQITEMLIRVVDEALANGTKKIDQYSIAAKTGTAEIVNPNTGKYYSDKFLHSFFGYFPAYDPEYLIFIYIKNPRGARYASQTLTDPFMDIARYLINYYDIQPDRRL